MLVYNRLGLLYIYSLIAIWLYKYIVVELLSFSKLAYIADLHDEEILIELSLVKFPTLSALKN